MALHVYRDARVEHLVEALADFVRRAAPADPFVPLPIVVGSRNVERWLRQELASQLGIAGNIVFPGPRSALRGAARWLLTRDPDRHARFWERSKATDGGVWESPALTFEVIAVLRSLRHRPSFDAVRAAIGVDPAPVSPRELAFAGDVAHCLEKLLGDRPHDALRWLASPAAAPDPHRWLADTLRSLHDARGEGSPAQLLAALAPRSPRGATRPLAVFGLSSPSPHDRHHLAAIAAHMPVHLFMLAPTPVWTGDDPARHELVRAAKKAAFADEREQALRALDGANLLLAASGVVGRDVQVWVEETELAIDGAVPRPTSPARTPSTLLERTQRFVADAAPMPAATDPSWPVDAHDHSLEVHACHGDLRQCEALREQLLQRFFDDSSLEPRHVIIMTPDVATFGPLLQAVLARPIDTERGGLPVHVSDLGLRLENPLAEALLALVQLAGERVTATRLLELFALAPVRRAFGIDDDAEPVLAELVHASNLRWAWSADDRAANGQPADAQNTVAFALERLALGTLMDDAADLVSAPAGDVFAPTPLRTAERVELFGKFAHALRTLRDVAESLVAPRSVSDWSSALRATLARVTAITDLEIPWRRRIESTLDELLPAATRDVPATADRMLERAAVLALLEPAFDLPGASGGAYGGAITVCALEPMRAVPFRVVAIVGLSEGAFPRQGVAAEWDPFAKRKPGEPTRTALDRHLFLEALLSARDAFWLFGNGFDPKRGTERPLAAVCHEVLTVLEAHTRLPAKSLLRAHALQPWSHAPGEAPVSFDRPWVSASEAISRVRDRGTPELAALQRTGGASMFPPLAPPRGDLTAARLAQHLDSAARALVEGRLDLRLRKPSDEPADREPLDAKDLEKWDLYDELVERLPLELLQDNGAAEAYDSLRRWARTHGRAAGTLPPGARGAFDLDRLFVDLDAGIDRLRQGAAGKRIETGASYTYRVGAVTITGRAPFALGTGDECVLSWLSPGGVHPTRELEAWLTLLVARAAGVPLAAAFVASAKEGRRFRAPEPHVAAQLLQDLVATLVRSQEGPVLRAPRFSYAIAKAASRARGANAGEAPSSQSLVEDALDLWASSSFKKGALDDRYTFELFGHWTDADLERHADRIVAEAEAVWGPLHDAVEKAPRTKGTVNE